MHYELTEELLTGNGLIDTEHRQLFGAVNDLLDACSLGEGRARIEKTVRFLNDYVGKHFRDEEELQIRSGYPGYPAHRDFHDGYRRQLADTAQALLREGPTVKALGELNRMAGVLVAHIRTEDKRLAKHVQEQCR